jgi:thiol-disulfide isomerase/thioredoxin
MAPAADPEDPRSGEGKRPGAPRPGGGARPSRVYSLLVGAAFIALIAVALVNTLRTTGGGLLGAGGDRGTAMPQFAVPDALGSVEGDANVYQDDCESSEIPCPADQRRTPACEVSGRGVIRVCDFFDRPLVISFWFSRGGDCLPAQDLVDRIASRYRGRVNFLSVNIRDDRTDVREVVRDRGWRLPVGHDADGAVSNIYRVGVCPTVAFLYPGGILRGASVGTEELDQGALAQQVERLLRESRRRARTDR